MLRARFADAQFFWDQDRKTPLEARVPKLDDLVFHAKLGTIGDKVRRLQPLAQTLAHAIGASGNDTLVQRAALLCKADLVTGMVGEFPELQGKMGRYYALDQGEDRARRRRDRRALRAARPERPLPDRARLRFRRARRQARYARRFLRRGETPTGSKDPYALRRAALGVIRIIVENGLRLPMRPPLKPRTRATPPIRVRGEGDVAGRRDGARAARLLRRSPARASARHGARHDLVAAVFALGDEDDLVRLLARVDALAAFLAGEDGANLLTAYKRASNIVRREETKDATRYDGAPDPALFATPEERSLYDELARATSEIREHARREDFAGAMAALARLRPSVDVFFDNVTVNADEPALRANRLRLLAGIRSALDSVADFSKVEG